MLGLVDVAGHAQTVRPLLAPMAESAAGKTHGELSREDAQRVQALAAATENVGRFFGEDVFLDGFGLQVGGQFAPGQAGVAAGWFISGRKAAPRTQAGGRCG